MIAVFALMLVLPMVLAFPTTIDIKTLPNHDVDITFLAPGEGGYTVYNKTKGFSNLYGDLTVEFEVNKNTFDVGVFVKDNNGKKVIYKRFSEGYGSGDKIYLEVAPEGYEFEENPFGDLEAPEESEEVVEEVGNETEEGEEEVVEEEIVEEVVEEEVVDGAVEGEEVSEEDVDAESLTGNVVGNVTSIINESKYYVLGVIVLVVVIVGVVAGIRSKSFGKGFGEAKKAIMHSDDKPPTILADAELEDAEKRLGEAERELKDVKAKFAKKAAAQEKFREAQKELAEAEKNFAKEDSEE